MEYKSWKDIPKEALEMITGKLLGDGNLTIQPGRKTRLRFSHKVVDQNWCEHCYKELLTYLPVNPPVYRKVMDTRIKAGFTEHFYVQSKTSQMLEVLKDCWYKGNVKVLPKEIIEKVISPLCLAWWYQDDGHLKITNNKVKKLILSTDYFTREENQFLINTLYSKFNLSFKLDKQNRIILYNQPQILHFLSIVEPYIIMERKKLSNEIHFLQKLTRKRTTIYLPSSIFIEKPTRDILNSMKELPHLMMKTIEEIQWLYQNTAQLRTDISNRPYQITIPAERLQQLQYLQQKTGLRKNIIVELCFQIKNGHLQRDDH
ncbi:endonuclease [Fictibacillus sp. WQ 8-8]|uniref:endonuclease n=1 Tax=Fictibacillus sp. WQ 8-8 TaxID=2938788 RepID=UPI00210B886E|nr:endonuclease [Fictibacillus sp. WQ 8-8]MCQ6264397.1 endonuclease [Fictibacillus sp. WQ 8-8]